MYERLFRWFDGFRSSVWFFLFDGLYRLFANKTGLLFLLESCFCKVDSPIQYRLSANEGISKIFYPNVCSYYHYGLGISHNIILLLLTAELKVKHLTLIKLFNYPWYGNATKLKTTLFLYTIHHV